MGAVAGRRPQQANISQTDQGAGKGPPPVGRTSGPLDAQSLAFQGP
jgi:hypothetical protein